MTALPEDSHSNKPMKKNLKRKTFKPKTGMMYDIFSLLMTINVIPSLLADKWYMLLLLFYPPALCVCVCLSVCV